MRVLLISDIHANPWALRAVLEDAGAVSHVLCAGDLVNYGPDPATVVNSIRALIPTVVRGNHDHAVAFGADPHASTAEQPLAMVMRDWTHEQLSPTDIGWLVGVPRSKTVKIGGATFAVFHATPVDPLYDYRLTPGINQKLLEELTAGVSADFVVVGHTHLPLTRKSNDMLVINPGSVGQPLDGDPRAAYGIWNDGDVELRRVDYDRSELFKQISALPLSKAQVADLLFTVKSGELSLARVDHQNKNLAFSSMQ